MKKIKFIRPMRTKTCIHKNMHTQKHAYTKTCIHKNMHTQKHAYTKICIHLCKWKNYYFELVN